MANKKPSTGLIVNRQARRDYATQQIFEAGVVLSGAEVKSLRQGHGHLRGSYVMVKDNELWLINATITPTNTNRNSFDEGSQTRTRKLLIKQKELKQLAAAKEQGLAIIPLTILNKKRFIKVQIATARGLKKFDKRERLKKRDTDLDIARSLTR